MITDLEITEAQSPTDPEPLLRKSPLVRMLVRNEDGGPIKSPLAVQFPMLSRRQRRAMQRNDRKAQS